MKRTAQVAIAVAALLAWGATEAGAQGFGVGARGGLNYSSLSDGAADAGQEIGWTTGFHAGLALTSDVHEYFGFEVDALYTTKGAKITEDLGGGSMLEGTLVPAYLQIPVLGRFRLPLGGVTPRLLAGGAVAFELSCKANGEVDGTTVIDNVDCDDPSIGADERKGTEWSLLGGVGVEIGAGPAMVFLDAMYNLGVTNLDATGTDDVKSKAWMFSVGVVYKVGLN
jgi:hypothetical protein